MAYDEIVKSVSMEADATVGIYTGVPGMPGSLSPNQGKARRFVKVTGANTVGLAGAADGRKAYGVLLNKPQRPGAACEVARSGIVMCEAGGTITAGQNVKLDATSRPITATDGTDDAAVVGTAVTSGTIGSLVSVDLRLQR